MVTQGMAIFPNKMSEVIPIVAFVGKSNSGKTTLIEKVVRELKLRGYRLGVIKHSHHDFDIDQPGKDTWRFRQAGSDVVAISSPQKLALIEYVDTELTLEEIRAIFQGRVNMVLAEGYKNSDMPKIRVLGINENWEMPYRGDTLAVVSPRLTMEGMPQFDDEDVAKVTKLLLDQLGPELTEREPLPLSRMSYANQIF